MEGIALGAVMETVAGVAAGVAGVAGRGKDTEACAEALAATFFLQLILSCDKIILSFQIK